MKFYQELTEIFTALLILFFVGLIVTNAQPSVYTLQIGTKIKLRMDNEINSKVSNVNDTFTATISSPVIVRDVEIIPVGAVVEGKIISVKAASTGKVNGTLEVKFETLRLGNEVNRQIDASLVNQNLAENKSSIFTAISILGGAAIGGVLGAITGKAKGAVIGAGVGIGAGATVGLLKKGKEARIKANQEFEIRLNKEVTVPAQDF